MFVTALRENLTAESLRHFGIEDTLLLEQREGIGRKYLGPLVTVITGSISAGKKLWLKAGDIAAPSTTGSTWAGAIAVRSNSSTSPLERLVDRMPCHVVEPVQQLADIEISRLIVLCGDDLGNQVGRNRFSGL